MLWNSPDKFVTYFLENGRQSDEVFFNRLMGNIEALYTTKYIYPLTGLGPYFWLVVLNYMLSLKN